MYNIEELASEVAETNDIDYSVALRLVALYIEQMNYVDRKNIDIGNIPVEDAEFIRGCIASNVENNVEAIRKIDVFIKAVDAYGDTPHDDGMLRSVRERQAISTTIDAGRYINDIMMAAHLTPEN